MAPNTPSQLEEGEIVDSVSEDLINYEMPIKKKRVSRILPEISTEIVNQGWNKAYIKREERISCLNNQNGPTKWNMPDLHNSHGGVPSEKTKLNSPIEIIKTDDIKPEKMEPEGIEPEVIESELKTDDFIPQFNLEILSYVRILVQSPIETLQAHPETEMMRSDLMMKLFKSFENQCIAWHKSHVPDCSFQSWIMEAKITNKDDFNDPLIPSDIVGNPYTITMSTAILEDIPFRIEKCNSIKDAKDQLNRYLKETKKIICSDSVPSIDYNNMILTDIDITSEWVNENCYETVDDYQDKIIYIKQLCQPFVNEIFKSSVDGQCSSLLFLSSNYSQQLRSKLLRMIGYIPFGRMFPRPPIKKDWCHPIRFRTGPFHMPPISYKKNDERIILTFQTRSIPVCQEMNEIFFIKLEQLYRLNCLDDKKYKLFLPRVWCLLKRYQTLSSEYNKATPTSAEILQASLSAVVFKTLHFHFGVTFECFASPMNCYFRQYCSAFIDTDAHFGSQGSFFSFYPIMGSFEANPPPVDGLINATLEHIEILLKNSEEPLSFIVFLPDRVPQKGIIKSSFFRLSLSVSGLQNRYRHGYEYMLSESVPTVQSENGLVIYWLQNDAGFSRWQPTKNRIKKLQQALST